MQSVQDDSRKGFAYNAEQRDSAERITSLADSFSDMSVSNQSALLFLCLLKVVMTALLILSLMCDHLVSMPPLGVLCRACSRELMYLSVSAGTEAKAALIQDFHLAAYQGVVSGPTDVDW